MYLIVGLGNPGTKYENTRHNAGFLAIDYIANHMNIQVKRSKFRGMIGDGELFGERVILAKPQTFMNLSGECVVPLANFYKIPPEKIIIVYDDVYVGLGKVRVRRKGSDGGHNGMKNIIELLGTNEFPRVRIGIGILPEGDLIYDWVLEEFSKEEIKTLDFDKVLEGIELIVRESSGGDRE